MPSLKYDIIVDGNKGRVALQQFANETDAAFKRSEAAVSRISLAALPEHERAVVKVHRKYQALDAQIKQLEKSGRISSSIAAGWHEAIGVQMQGDLQRLESQGKRTFSSLSDSAKIFIASFAAMGAMGAVALIKDVSMLAARYETLGVVMGVVGNNAGYTKAEMDGFAQSLRNSGIAALESRQVLSMMAQANIDMADSSKLARVAQDAAVIGNINSSEAFQRLVYGIQSAQVEMLRTIGINTTFEGGYKTMAASIGKTSAELTEQEKMQSRVNSVLNAGTQIAGTYEAAMGTAGKQILSMKRYSDDLKVSIGEAFTPALALVVEQLSDGLKSANKSMEANSSVAKEWGNGLRSVIISVEAEMLRMAMLADKAGGSLTAAGAFLTFGKTDEKFREWNKMYEERYKASDAELQKLADLSIALKNEASSAAGASAAEAELEKKRIAAGKAARELTAAQSETEGLEKAEKAILKIDKALESYFSTIDEQVKKNQMVNISNDLTDFFADIDQSTAIIEKQRKAWDDLNTAALPEHVRQIEEITKKYQEYDRVLTDLVSSGSLSFEDAADIDLGLAANWQTEMDDIEKITLEKTGTISAFWEEAQKNMQSTSKSFFFDAMKGNFDDLGSRFEDVILDMVANWQAAQLQMALWGSNANAAGGFGNGLIAAGVDSIFSGTTQNAGIDAALTSFYSFHSGGKVGVDGSPGVASSSLWNNAPRFHSGLAGDEFPAILQRGETVIPKGSGGGGTAVTVNVVNNASGTQATTKDSTDSGGNRVIDIMVEQITGKMGSDIGRGKGLAPVLESRYGLNSAWGMNR